MAPLQLPNRIFAVGEEPIGHRVNSYHKTNRLNSILNALGEEEREALKSSPFGKLISTAEKPSYSGTFGQYIITRMLNVKKKHEIWILFAGRPIRISLREFGIVTGLSCAKLPSKFKKKKRLTIKEKPYWPILFGNLQSCTVDLATDMLRRKAVTDKDTRFKYACLAIVGGVLFPTSHRPKISKEHVELIRDINEFFAFPWGRLAFDKLMSSIKEKDVVVLSQSTLVVKGFFHAVQLVMVEAVPALLEVVQVNEISSSEGESEGEGGEPAELEPLGLDMEGPTGEIKLSLSPVHAREVDEECKAVVDSIIADNGDTNVDLMDLGWSDDEDDENVDNLVKLVGEEFVFEKHMFKGGLTLVELNRLREEKKETEKKAKKEKEKGVQKNNNIDASVIAGLVMSKIGEGLLALEGKISQVYEKVKDVEEMVNCLENKLTTSIDRKFSELETSFVTRILISLEKYVDVGKNVSPTVSLDATNMAPMGNRFGGSPLGYEVNKSMGTYAETTGVINGVLGALNSLNVPEGNHDGGKSSKPNCSSLVSEAVNNGVSFGGEEGNRDGGRSSTPNGSSLVSEAANNGVSFGGKEVEQLNDPSSFEQTFVEGEEDCGGDKDLDHDKGETMNVVVEHDGNVVRKSKRQRVVPPVLKDFQLDRHTLGFVKAPMFGFDPNADYVAKFADLQELLKSPCIVSLGNGSSLNNKDILEIARRTKIMGAKSMDALMHYTSVSYHKQSHCTVDKKIQFFDTKFTSLLIKHFTKFSRIAAKDKEKFVFQENLMEYFVNDGGSNGIVERFYFPFNLDKQHWVGVCVDINQKAVIVLDCNLSFRTDSLIKKDLLPVAQMVPYVMKGVMKERKVFSLERVRGIPHNGNHLDSGVTVVLLIQAYAHGGVEECKSITPGVVELESKKLAVVLYEEFA